jgi:Tfp pilus assembly protein PilX
MRHRQGVHGDRRRRAPGRAAAGSAYLVVLLVLVVLTIIGLSLVTVTQTEMQIGSNERLTNRAFYSADAGVGIATARVLVTNDHRAKTFTLQDSDSGSSLNLGETVEISPFHPILDAPCNLCTINQGSDFYEINHAVTVRATRRGWTGAGPDADSPTLAQRAITVMIELQPWQLTAESFDALDTEELASIHF